MSTPAPYWVTQGLKGERNLIASLETALVLLRLGGKPLPGEIEETEAMLDAARVRLAEYQTALGDSEAG